jgi:SAM-dependent methyltransferase
MLEDSGLEPSKDLDVLDAGCGTGLCGPLVATYARRLTGVDLSSGMLAQAKAKWVYDALVKGELTEYLRNNVQSFDLIVSADTLVYFGELEPVVSAAAGALRPNGLFIFSLEHAQDGAADLDGHPGYHLELHGRYSHSRAYVEQLLTDAGFAPEIAQAHLRTESGVPVNGLVVRASKSLSVRVGGKTRVGGPFASVGGGTSGGPDVHGGQDPQADRDRHDRQKLLDGRDPDAGLDLSAELNLDAGRGLRSSPGPDAGRMSEKCNG